MTVKIILKIIGLQVLIWLGINLFALGGMLMDVFVWHRPTGEYQCKIEATMSVLSLLAAWQIVERRR